MNINKKFLCFSVFFIFLIASVFFLSAQEGGEEPTFTDYSDLTDWEGLEKTLSGTNVVVDESDSGFLIFSSKELEGDIIVKLGQGTQIWEYDLSRENAYLKINATTGEVFECIICKSTGKSISLGKDIEKFPPNIRDLPEGTVYSFKKDEGLLSIKFPENVGKFSEETFIIKNGEEFDISFEPGDDGPIIQTFKVKTKEGTKISFLNGEFSFSEGEVSMARGEWNFPFQSTIDKFPKTMQKGLTVLGAEQTCPISAIMMIRGEEIVVSRKASPSFKGFSQDPSFTGVLALEDDLNAFVPALGEETTFSTGVGVKSNGKLGISRDVYVFPNKATATKFGKSTYISGSETEKFNFVYGGAVEYGDNVELNFKKDNIWVGEFMEEEDRFAFSGGLQTGSISLERGSKDFPPFAELKGKGVTIGNNGHDLNIGKGTIQEGLRDEITVDRNDRSDNPYRNKEGIILHTIATLPAEEDKPERLIGIVATNKGKKLHFDSSAKFDFENMEDAAVEFQTQYRNYGVKSILNENIIISPQSLVQGRITMETVNYLDDETAAQEYATLADKIKEINGYVDKNINLYDSEVLSYFNNDKDKTEEYIGQIKNVRRKGEQELEDFIDITGNEPIVYAEDTINNEDFNKNIRDYQILRQKLIDKKIIRSDNADFPNLFGYEEKEKVNKIMTSRNVNYEEAVDILLFEKNYKIIYGPRLRTLQIPPINPIIIWESRYKR